MNASVHHPIIDTHQHLWDMKQFSPPWLHDAAESKINRPSNMADYIRETKGLNVVATLYMEVDIDPRQHIEEANWVSDVCRSGKTPMVGGVVSARPNDPRCARYIRRYRNDPYILGFRQVLQVPDALPGLCLQQQFVKNIQLCGEFGKTFDFCIRSSELQDALTLAKLCPDTRFILDHCGNGSARNPNQAQWEMDIAAIAKQKNVVCKISGIVKTVKPEWDITRELFHVVRHVYKCFGPNRIMFGGDWPVCNKTKSFKAWVTALDAIFADLSDGDLRKFYHDNAVAFYGLSSRS